jgi:dienelactone hydrolase
MKKKFLALLLTLCMVLSLAATAFAADTDTAVTTAAPATTAALPFTDVVKGSWYYDAVSYTYQNGLFKGTGTAFLPNDTMTRAMFVTVLYRQAGSPAVKDADTAWYGAAAKWAKDNSVSDGTNLTSAITREQFITQLYRYTQLQKLGMGRSESYSAFKDAAKVDTWADAAMQWAVGSGIVTGSGTNLNPLANITRAEAATILYRYLTGNATKYTETVVTVTSADGTAVPATLCVPASATNAPGVVMLHGTGSARDEAGNGYKTAAPILAAQYGVATIRIDFRGNGDSKADYMSYTFKTAVEDAVAAAKYLGALSNVDENKIGVMGWSQGGTDALLAAGEHPEIFKCVVTWAGAPDLSDMLSDADYAAAKKDGYFVMKFDWRTDLKVSLQWCEDVKNTDVLKVFQDGYTGPVLAIAGKKDTTVNPEWSNKIVAASSNKASATHFIDGMDHTFNVFSETDLHSLMNAIQATGTYFQTNLK